MPGLREHCLANSTVPRSVWPHKRVLSSPENVFVATVFYLCCFTETVGFISLGNLLSFVFPAESSFPIFRLYHFYYNELWEVVSDTPQYLNHHVLMVIWVSVQMISIWMKRVIFIKWCPLHLKMKLVLQRSFCTHDKDISLCRLYWHNSLINIYTVRHLHFRNSNYFLKFPSVIILKGSVTPLCPRQSCSTNESWLKVSCEWQKSNFVVGR